MDILIQILVAMENKSDRYRKNIRLKNFDYSSAGYYFVTIVSHNRKKIFGDIIGGKINLNHLGMIVEKIWKEIPLHFQYAKIDAYVVMPNHLHGIVIINEVGAQHEASRYRRRAEPLQKIKTQPLGVIVRSFKSAVTKSAHDLDLFVEEKIWQRNYYEHIIRDNRDYHKIIEYIENNPANWLLDEENIELE